ncbi:Rieske (2Fe-2S) protein [Carboxylicivirga sp. M1479]|nr:Rieske (2Fe-2S) protein [Carboxylicivirga sp. M1479]
MGTNFRQMKKPIYLFIVFISLSCSKDSVEIIPNIKFNASINLDNPQYAGSNPFIIRPGGTNRYVGINGVVVFEVSSSEFYAFDLMCTHQHEKTGAFFVDFDNIGDVVLVCPECQSEFNVAAEYGSIIKGPAKWPLKRYQTSVSGNTLRIWN